MKVSRNTGRVALTTSVPQVFIDLFSIEKKSVLESFCKGITVTDHEFCMLVDNCNSYGYRHIPKWREHYTHLLSDHDIESIRSLGVTPDKSLFNKIRRKTKALFNERRSVAAHFFVSSLNKWHLIYFSHDDAYVKEGNHWKSTSQRSGTHFHFVNYLWPEYNINMLWDKFNVRRQSISGSVHVAFLL